ncbi:hypothetical protein IW262DRAFT_1460748 [Armillaria fumosa]|nr:hypothetical protein IW262DRAFT_1460748 [Armillaria fumosa]
MITDHSSAVPLAWSFPHGLRVFKQVGLVSLKHLLPINYTTMTAYSNGLHVWMYNTKGQIVSGVVQSTSLMADGTQCVKILFANGKTTTVP